MPRVTMQRTLTPERMDEPSLPPDLHRSALDGLRRINSASGVVRQLLNPILAFAGGRSLSLLDVASGGGDVPVGVAAGARAMGVPIQLTMFDRSEVALEQAKEAADRAKVPATVLRGDVTNDDLPAADVVTCSLFLHHLSSDQTISVLRRLRLATNGLLLVSDLRRCVGGLIAAHIACRVLSRSPIVHFDGPVSAAAAWTRPELKALAATAGLPDAEIHSSWPFRQLLRWRNAAGDCR